MSDSGRAVVIELLSGPADGVVFASRRETGEEFWLLGGREEINVGAGTLAEVESATFTVTDRDTLRVAALRDCVVAVDGRRLDVDDEIMVGQVVKVGVTELLIRRIGVITVRDAASHDEAASEGDPSPDDETATTSASPVSGVVEFYPEELLHKFGFGDGDMLCELVEEHDLGVDHQDLLAAVVERLVVPRLDQTVETYTLVTWHNPIRAGTIDGEKAEIGSTLTPEVVEVPVADIIQVARTLPKAEDEGPS
jgi:hypothetical protein